MKISKTNIPGAVVVESIAFGDHRGMFSRFYCERDLEQIVGQRRIVQINHSRTHSVGAIRGFHYQNKPYAEMKLIRCIRGRVWDVAIDLRKESSTFLQWHAEELTPENAKMLVVPEGCAHGFQVLEKDSELLYLHTEFYNAEAEGGVLHDDPMIGVQWPLPVTEISQRDSAHPRLTSDYPGLSL